MADTSPDSDARLISAHGVSKQFGSVCAVDGVDLDVRAGEIFGLIGHNGAGKSTLFKMMLGLLAPSAGTLQVCGVDVRSGAFRAVRRAIGYLPENGVLYDNLSGLETLEFFARLKGAPRAQCLPTLEQVGLTAAARRPVREYSKGMRQRLCFAQALLGQPRLLFLDEPTNGLDPRAIRDFYQILQTLRDRGVSIVITSHILAELQGRVDRLAIMASGRIEACGTVAQLRDAAQAPVRMTLQIAPGAQEAALAAFFAAGLRDCHYAAGVITLLCPRADKRHALHVVGHLGAALLDIDIHEATLEELFFGLAE